MVTLERSTFAKELARTHLDTIVNIVQNLNANNIEIVDMAKRCSHDLVVLYTLDTKGNHFALWLASHPYPCRIVGTINELCDPVTARIEYKQRFRSWKSLQLTTMQRLALLDFCMQF